MSVRGLAWTLDFAAGIFIFVAALLLTTGLLIDSFSDRSFSYVQKDATALANALFSEGYPRNWDESDVVQAGLLWDGRLSERKLEALARMTPDARARVLPSVHRYAIVVEDVNGTVQGIGSLCAIGMDEFPTEANASLYERRLAYYARSGGPQQLRAFAEAHAADLFFDGNFSSLIDEGFRYGIVLLENPRLDLLVTSSLANESATDATLRESLRTLANGGPIIVVTGDTGIPILGSNTTSGVTDVSAVAIYDDPFVSLEPGATIDFSTKMTALSYLPDGYGTLGNRGGAQKPLLLLAATANQTTAARWQYQDGVVYYFQDTIGTYTNSTGSEDWKSTLERILGEMLVRAAYNCTVDPAALDAENVVPITRVAALRGATRVIKIFVWSG